MVTILLVFISAVLEQFVSAGGGLVTAGFVTTAFAIFVSLAAKYLKKVLFLLLI
jgi:hypothetical protein